LRRASGKALCYNAESLFARVRFAGRIFQRFIRNDASATPSAKPFSFAVELYRSGDSAFIQRFPQQPCIHSLLNCTTGKF
jgi:hypothetical protein